MSIQLDVCSALSLFAPAGGGGIRVNSEEERLANLEGFLELIRTQCKSVDLDLERNDDVEIIDLFVSDATLMEELTEKHFPELVSVIRTDLYLPCIDPNERFFLDFPIQSEGRSSNWKVCDMNALKEWVAKVREFNRTQELYDREKLALIVEDHERAIELSEKERCVINFSY